MTRKKFAAPPVKSACLAWYVIFFAPRARACAGCSLSFPQLLPVVCRRCPSLSPHVSGPVGLGTGCVYCHRIACGSRLPEWLLTIPM